MHLYQHSKNQNKVDLNQLRHVVTRLEMEQSERTFTALGVTELDHILSGGLEQNALHELIGPAKMLITSWWLNLIKGPIVWVSLKNNNIKPYMPGLKATGLDPNHILHLQLDNFDQLLSAVHRVLRDLAISVVVVDLDQPLNLSQARQWQLAAHKGKTTGLILSHDRSNSCVNSVITRWHAHVQAQYHSQIHVQLELIKNRYGPEAKFFLSLDNETSHNETGHAAYYVSLVAPLTNRTVNQAPTSFDA